MIMRLNKLFALFLVLVLLLPAGALAVTVTTISGDAHAYDSISGYYKLGNGVYEAELLDTNEEDRVLNVEVNGAATLRLKEGTQMFSLSFIGDNENDDSLKLTFTGSNEVYSIGYPNTPETKANGGGCKLEIVGVGDDAELKISSYEQGIRAEDLKISNIVLTANGELGNMPTFAIAADNVEIVDSEVNLSAKTTDVSHTGLTADGKLTITNSRVVVGMKADGKRGYGVKAGKGVTLNDGTLIIQGAQKYCLLTNGAVVLNGNSLVYASDAEACGIAVEDVTGTAVKVADTSAVRVEDCQIGINTVGTIEIAANKGFTIEGQERAVIGTIKRSSGVKTYHKNFAEDAWVNFTENSTTKQCVSLEPIAEIIYEEDGLPSAPVNMPAIVLDVESYGEKGVDLYVEKIDESVSGTEYSITYEAVLYNGDGEKVSLKELSKLIFPYPAGYTKADTHINYTIIHNKGTANEEYFSTADGSIKREDCGLVIEVDSLSPFELSWGESVKPNLPKTGDNSSIMLWASLLLVSGCLCALLYGRKTNEA